MRRSAKHKHFVDKKNELVKGVAEPRKLKFYQTTFEIKENHRLSSQGT